MPAEQKSIVQMYREAEDTIRRLEAELQAAQEREKALEALAAQRTKGPYYGSLTKMRMPTQRTEEPSDDEGLDPIETSPLTEREPDL